MILDAPEIEGHLARENNRLKPFHKDQERLGMEVATQGAVGGR